MNLNDYNRQGRGGCYTLNDYSEASERLSREGLPKGFESGLKNLDNLCRLDKGRLVTVTGVPQGGKSMLIDFLCTRYHIRHGFKTLFYSSETPLEIHLNTLSRMFQRTADEEFHKFLFQNFQIIDETQEWDIDSLLAFAQEKLETFPYDVFVIDNYAAIGCNRKNNLTEHEYISLVLDRLIKFAHKNDVMVILVAHPKKMDRDPDGGYQVPMAYDISGSSHFFNKSDFCLTVHRLWRNGKPLYITSVTCSKCKSQNYGGIGNAYLGFDPRTQSYLDIDYSPDEEPFEGVRQEPTMRAPELDFQYELEKREEGDTRDYLATEINVFRKVSDTTPEKCTLREVLFEKQKSFKSQIERVRNIEDKKDRQAEKANLLPCFSINCLFEGKRSKDNVSGVTRLMYVDIDEGDNSEETIERLPSFLKSIDNVLYYQKSASGRGYMCIIPIDIDNVNDFERAWQGVQRAFEENGVAIDRSTKDVSRVTFFSYDEDAYLNEAAVPYKPLPSIKEEKPCPKRFLPSLKQERQNVEDNWNTVLQYINSVNERKLDVAPTYETYRNLGIACLASFGLDKSKEVFPALCRYNKTFNEREAIADLEKWHDQYNGKYTCSFGTIKYCMENAKPVS